MILILALLSAWLFRVSGAQANTCKAVTQHLAEPPYDNYFYSDCHVDAQAVVTSPLPDSNLTIIGPRFIVAWPAGNSGICTFFQPSHGPNGSLAIELVNSTVGKPLAPVYRPRASSAHPFVGVQGVLSFNSSATLTLPILGSVRTIRDFTEGPSKLTPLVQDAINVTRYNETGAMLSRLWLDNVTISNFSMVPYQSSGKTIEIHPKNKTVRFGAGLYHFSASVNYPQLKQLTPAQVLNQQSQTLITQEASGSTSLSFLSYTNKLLAGAWRFLTYFGRDSMIAALLLEPVLSTGNGSATEAVIAAVLERINRTDGSVSHEETIGDYATLLNLQNYNKSSTASGQTYPMIDSDFYLPVIMSRYFASHPSRIRPLLSLKAGSEDQDNRGLTYANLTAINAQKIMNITAAFAKSQTERNLIHLKPDEIVGEWRDSMYGIGGGRIPFDVNTALVPAALRAISELATMPGVFPNTTSPTNYSSWSTVAASRAKIWEDETLQFFTTSMSASSARSRLTSYVSNRNNTYYSGPTHANALPPTGNITQYSIALNGYDDLSAVDLLHSDTSFRLFFLNTTNDTQLTSFINNTADSLNRPFPAGLMTPVGMVVANPALSGSDVLVTNVTNSAYHGTVVWSWTLAMMAQGLERQLARCNGSRAPAFCHDRGVHGNVVKAYNSLWDVIEANEESLESEVWSWTYSNGTGYKKTPLGALPPPPGTGPGTESDIRQLWSLTFLAVKRNRGLQ